MFLHFSRREWIKLKCQTYINDLLNLAFNLGYSFSNILFEFFFPRRRLGLLSIFSVSLFQTFKSITVGIFSLKKTEQVDGWMDECKVHDRPPLQRERTFLVWAWRSLSSRIAGTTKHGQLTLGTARFAYVNHLVNYRTSSLLAGARLSTYPTTLLC